MANASNYLETNLLDQIVGKTDYTMPTASIALCTADPTDAGTGASMNELPDASGYARVETAGGDWDAAADGATANAAAFTFTANGGAWAEVTHFAIVDSAVHGAGNMLIHGELDVAKTAADGESIEFAIGALDLSLA